MKQENGLEEMVHYLDTFIICENQTVLNEFLQTETTPELNKKFNIFQMYVFSKYFDNYLKNKISLNDKNAIRGYIIGNGGGSALREVGTKYMKLKELEDLDVTDPHMIEKYSKLLRKKILKKNIKELI